MPKFAHDVSPLWRYRLISDPVKWAGPALETYGNTIRFPISGGATTDGSGVVISSAPLVRDLFLAGLLGPSPRSNPAEAPGPLPSTFVRPALEALLDTTGKNALAQETGRAVTLIERAQDPELNLLRVTRSVYYRTVLGVLVGPDTFTCERTPLQELCVLCDTIAENPANHVTGEMNAAGSTALTALRARFKSALVSAPGVVPQQYRALPAHPPGLADEFAALLSVVIVAVEPAARVAADTLDYCLRNGLLKPSEEFQGCIRRAPPIPFFVREVTKTGLFRLDFNLRKGDRVLLHLPSMFDADPHTPYHDAFGIGAQRCLGSAIATAYLRSTLDPLYKSLCVMMAAPTRKPRVVKLDTAAAWVHPWRSAGRSGRPRYRGD